MRIHATTNTTSPRLEQLLAAMTPSEGSRVVCPPGFDATQSTCVGNIYTYWPSYDAPTSFCKLLEEQESASQSRNLSGELDKIYQACSRANWDGYGATPVKKHLRPIVESFLHTLPREIPDPEISADPDGEISLEWYYEPRKVFSISVGDSGRLAYASLDGEKKTSGIDKLGKEIPQAIIHRLQEFFSDIT